MCYKSTARTLSLKDGAIFGHGVGFFLMIINVLAKHGFSGVFRKRCQKKIRCFNNKITLVKQNISQLGSFNTSNFRRVECNSNNR